VVVSAGLVVVVVVVEVSEVVPLGLAAGAAVSVFCSHAANIAAPAKIQMSLFISLELSSQYWVIAESEQAPFFGCAHLPAQSVRRDSGSANHELPPPRDTLVSPREC
jgi:hypothetical protein